METKLAEMERGLVPMASKQQELTQLVQKKLAPAHSLAQINQEMHLLARRRRPFRRGCKRTANWPSKTGRS